MKEVNLKVSGVYGLSWAKKFADRWTKQASQSFSHFLNFATNENGILCLKSDSKPLYDALLERLNNDLNAAKHAATELPRWNQGEMLIEDLTTGEIGVLDISNIESLTKCMDYIRDQLLHAIIPSKRRAILNNQPLSSEFCDDLPFGKGVTKLCVIYAVQTDNRLVEVQASISLKLLAPHGNSWSLVDGQDNFGNYYCSLEEYKYLTLFLDKDLSKLQNTDQASCKWYHGRAYVSSTFALSDGKIKKRFSDISISSLNELENFYTYVKEKLPFFLSPDDALQKKANPQGAPIVTLFDRNDDKNLPLLQRPQLAEDIKDSYCSCVKRMLKKL